MSKAASAKQDRDAAARSRGKAQGAAARGRREGPPRLDAAGLSGITALMNTQNVRPGINLDDAEKTVMGKNPGGAGKRPDLDPVRLYTSELNQLAEELGIDLLDDGDPTAKATAPQAPAPGRAPPERATPSGAPDSPRRGSAAKAGAARGPVRSRIDDLIDDLNLDDDVGGAGRAAPPKSKKGAGAGVLEGSGSKSEECDCDDDCPDDCSCACHSESESGSGEDGSSSEECDCDDDCKDDCSCACHAESESGSGSESGDDGDDEKVDRIIARLEGDLGIQTDGKRERRRHRLRAADVPHAERRHGGDRDRPTAEQERRRHINSVVADIRGETRTTFGVERERVQDIKASKLEQIGQLRMTLEEEGIDCSGVSNPTPESPMSEIDSVLNILRLKNDRNRYSSLAEEVLIGGAEAIESVFDGSRAIPLLGWRPDYTGYSSTVNCKLHRMRFETSQIVGNIIEKYNIGPTARIILELLPSFFLYPRQQKKQRGNPGLSSDPHVANARDAMSTIRRSDEPGDLTEARRI